MDEAESSNAGHSSYDDAASDNSHCSICFERYATHGDKRPCCLQCGHIFCKGCIDRWIRTPGNSSQCPVCNRRFRKREVRVLYITGIAPVDNSELVRVMEELRSCKERLRNVEVQIAQARYEARVKCELAERLATENAELKRIVQLSSVDQSRALKLKPLHMLHSFPIQQHGDPCCRVMAYDGRSCSMFVSCRAPTFVNSHGVQMIDMIANRKISGIFTSKNEVRDIRIDPWNTGTFMVATLDQLLRVFTTKDLSHVVDINIGEPAWSCCYNGDVPSLVFVATGSGKVKMCDLRMTGSRTIVAELCDMKKPVISLQWHKARSVGGVPPGLMATSMNECLFLSTTSGTEMSPNVQPFAGNFFSLVQDETTGHFLLSTSPSVKVSTCSYDYFCLNRDDSVCAEDSPRYTSSVIRKFSGGKSRTILNRNCLFFNGDSSVAAVYNEDLHAIQLWNVNRNEYTSTIRVEGTKENKVYDITCATLDDLQQKIFALTKGHLYTYQFD